MHQLSPYGRRRLAHAVETGEVPELIHAAFTPRMLHKPQPIPQPRQPACMHVRSKTPPQAATQTQTSPYDLELPSRNVRLSGGYLEEPHPPGELLSYANEAIAWLRITLASEPASQSAINVLAAVLTELGSSASILSDEVFELERALIQSDTSGRAWAAAFGSEREAFLRAAEEWEAERAEREAEVAEVWDELKQEVGEVWEGVRVARQQEQREAAASVREALKRFGAELRREEGRRKRAEGELIAERRLRQAEAEAAARMLEESCVAQQRHARALRDAVAQNKGAATTSPHPAAASRVRTPLPRRRLQADHERAGRGRRAVRQGAQGRHSAAAAAAAEPVRRSVPQAPDQRGSAQPAPNAVGPPCRNLPFKPSGPTSGQAARVHARDRRAARTLRPAAAAAPRRAAAQADVGAAAQFVVRRGVKARASAGRYIARASLTKHVRVAVYRLYSRWSVHVNQHLVDFGTSLMLIVDPCKVSPRAQSSVLSTHGARPRRHGGHAARHSTAALATSPSLHGLAQCGRQSITKLFC